MLVLCCPCGVVGWGGSGWVRGTVPWEEGLKKGAWRKTKHAKEIEAAIVDAEVGPSSSRLSPSLAGYKTEFVRAAKHRRLVWGGLGGIGANINFFRSTVGTN